MKDKISASVMCADLLHLEKDIKELKKSGVDYLHWDIMDGVFVPNFSMNPDIMKAVKTICDIEYDTHLMITDPGKYIDVFAEAGTDMMVVHVETTVHLHRVIQKIKQKGLKAGVALNPATPVREIKEILPDIDMVLVMTVNPGYAGQKMIGQTLNKIEEVRELIKKNKFDIDLQVDGNVSFENAVKMKKRGANVFVVGSSSIFNENLSIETGVKKIKKMINKV
ncbi:MAG: ribulose-phosphate 3-epimerase [bacterium]